MTPGAFIVELNDRLGGDVEREISTGIGTVRGAPRLLVQVQGRFIKFDFVIDSELLIEVNLTPPFTMLIRRKRALAKVFSLIGMGGVGTGDRAFDRVYSTLYITKHKARSVLTGEVKGLIEKLAPFDEFRLTHREYACLKSGIDLSRYTPADAIADMNTLTRLVDVLQESGVE